MLLGAYAAYDTDGVKRTKNQQDGCRHRKASIVQVKKLGESDRETNADVLHHPSPKKITAIMDCAEP
jgi:hypothetical protein